MIMFCCMEHPRLCTEYHANCNFPSFLKGGMVIWGRRKWCHVHFINWALEIVIAFSMWKCVSRCSCSVLLRIQCKQYRALVLLGICGICKMSKGVRCFKNNKWYRPVTQTSVTEKRIKIEMHQTKKWRKMSNWKKQQHLTIFQWKTLKQYKIRLYFI